MPTELAIMKQLCRSVDVSSEFAEQLAAALASASAEGRDAPLMPRTTTQLFWFGLDAGALNRLAPFVVLLPAHTPVNVNTASPEVIAAVAALQPADAEQLVRLQQQAPFRTLSEAMSHLSDTVALDESQFSVGSRPSITTATPRATRRASPSTAASAPTSC